MAPEPEKKVRGLARVAFIANLAAIKTELAEGWTAKSIFDRHADKLAGKVSYPQFVRYVRQLREVEATSPFGRASPPALARPMSSPVQLPKLSDVTAFNTPAAGASANARHEPAGRPTFQHDGRTKEGEPEQLFGPGFLPGRK